MTLSFFTGSESQTLINTVSLKGVGVGILKCLTSYNYVSMNLIVLNRRSSTVYSLEKCSWRTLSRTPADIAIFLDWTLI